eukprot:g66119.t1
MCLQKSLSRGSQYPEGHQDRRESQGDSRYPVPITLTLLCRLTRGGSTVQLRDSTVKQGHVAGECPNFMGNNYPGRATHPGERYRPSPQREPTAIQNQNEKWRRKGRKI